MNNYETMFILNTKVSEESRNNAISRIKSFISENGKITKEDAIGEKRLAYEIKKQNVGYYYVIEFSIEPQHIRELERIYRITDEVIKFITIKRDE